MALRFRRSTIFGVIVLAGIVVACGAVTAAEEHGDASLRTDANVYQLQRDSRGNLTVEIPFTYHNTTGKTVYLVNCNGAVPPSLEKWQDGEWVAGWNPVVLLCLSPPIQVPPNGVYEDTLRVLAAPYGSNAGPQFEVADPDGTYRLVWHVALHDYDLDDPPAGTPLPLENRLSNSFDLRAP